jgi:hypothetical protein
VVLLQNYPNPFNPSTTIAFELPAPSDVRLVLYDLLGQEVATLIDGTRYPTGRHLFELQAPHLAAGTYFYRFTAGEYSMVRKLMILR